MVLRTFELGHMRSVRFMALWFMALWFMTMVYGYGLYLVLRLQEKLLPPKLNIQFNIQFSIIPSCFVHLTFCLCIDVLPRASNTTLRLYDTVLLH